MVERPLTLKGSNCKAYQKPKGGGAHHLPIVSEMYGRGEYPFRLNWPNAEVTCRTLNRCFLHACMHVRMRA